MPNFIQKLKKVLVGTPTTARKSKSTGDLDYALQTQTLYVVREKDLPKLHLAAWRGDLQKVIDNCSAERIDYADKEYRTALHLAVAANHLNIVDFLVKRGAKIMLDRDKRTPFVLAAINGNAKAISLLLNNPNDRDLINEPDNNGLSPLFYAIRHPNGQAMLELITGQEFTNLAVCNRVRFESFFAHSSSSKLIGFFHCLFVCLFVCYCSRKETRHCTTRSFTRTTMRYSCLLRTVRTWIKWMRRTRHR